MRAKRRMERFSPILPTRAVRTLSTVPSRQGSAERAATSAGSRSATMPASSATKPRKSSFLATKSVSQLTSMIAPRRASGATWIPTTPSAAIRDAALLALLPSLTRRMSSALAMSPSASVRAFLHSIMGASVLARNSFTMPAVISAIVFSSQGRLSPRRKSRRRPAAETTGAATRQTSTGPPNGSPPGLLLLAGLEFVGAFDLDELFLRFLRDLGQGAGTRRHDGVGRRSGIQAHRPPGVIVARDHVGNAV